MQSLSRWHGLTRGMSRRFVVKGFSALGLLVAQRGQAAVVVLTGSFADPPPPPSSPQRPLVLQEATVDCSSATAHNRRLHCRCQTPKGRGRGTAWEGHGITGQGSAWQGEARQGWAG